MTIKIENENTMMNPNSYFNFFIDKLNKSETAQELWRGKKAWDNPSWTLELTIKLAEAAEKTLNKISKLQIAAKGKCDKYGRNEYFNLDITVYDDDSWKPPLLIVEHENSSSEDKILYCAWKLLSVYAKLRVLVVYFDSTNTYTWYKKSQSEIINLLVPISDEIKRSNKHLMVILGDWGGNLENGWDKIFTQLDLFQP